MNKNLCLAAFLAGSIAVAWVGAGYVGTHPLALTMTAIIAAVYALGALELFRFEQATATLARALDAIPPDLARLDDWLDRIHPSLRNPVRLRVEGERAGLPGPAVTPYLVGLLVMLGMLGSFLGMVVTLNGAVLALESTTDLQTIRAALAAPVKGLGLAFGTSVAGVAASAMLGLISALCRRERLRAGQGLDTRIAGALRDFSLAHQRQETFRAIQSQARTLPEVVDKLQAMMTQMERQNLHLNERLLANQEGFQRDVGAVYTALADSVDRSLRDGLSESARLAGATIRPAVESAMAGIARETAALHERVAATVDAQLGGIATRFDAAVGSVEATWTTALDRHERTGASLGDGLRTALESFAATFEQRSAALLAGVGEAHGALHTELADHDARRQAALLGALEAMAASLRAEWQQAGAHTLTQQQEICRALERTARDIGAQAQAHAGDTIAEVSRLMQTAAEVPRVAAEVIGELRQQLSHSLTRDNQQLEERSRVMQTLGTLLDAIDRAATEQRGAIEALVNASAAMLDRVGDRFAEQVADESARMSEVAAQVSGSAVEVASLGESFGLAVQLFAESNEQLVASLRRIEGSLDKSLQRSDDQLAYYVAQAREIIDLSLMSQQRIVDDLQQRAGTPARLADEAA